MKKLAIKEVAEQTGVAAGTIRMWEQRYGFPEPGRTASGYRVYTEENLALRRKRPWHHATAVHREQRRPATARNETLGCAKSGSKNPTLSATQFLQKS